MRPPLGQSQRVGENCNSIPFHKNRRFCKPQNYSNKNYSKTFPSTTVQKRSTKEQPLTQAIRTSMLVARTGGMYISWRRDAKSLIPCLVQYDVFTLPGKLIFYKMECILTFPAEKNLPGLASLPVTQWRGYINIFLYKLSVFN